VLLVASPKFQLHAFTVPELVVEISVKVTVGQADVLNVKSGVQVIHDTTTVFCTVSKHALDVPMIRVTV